VSRRRAFLEVAVDGLRAVDDGGTIISANREFQREWGCEMASLAGCHVEEILDVRFDDLVAGRGRATDPFAMRFLPSGQVCFGLARAPRRPRAAVSSTSFAPTAEDAPAAAADQEAPERAALLAALRENRWNVTRTAARLATCRATVYRRMQRHGIVPPNRRD
ncbi:MAG TPA: helix-turn-helix domain-containing protein, partial [Burkholderiaceae bacterium]|nr:helix-turn-helix domain-containing protein [Burkholderiaceae bacterium]